MSSFFEEDLGERVAVKAPCVDAQKLFSRMFKRTVILIAGPTSVGKTAVSLALASMINGEVVSVDSMQVYRHMDIGTAKVTLEERKQIPHHLIDIRHVRDTFSVVDFYHEAIRACQEIFSRNKVPILTGGTGFYFHTFLNGIPEGPPSDLETRRYLRQELEKNGVEALYQKVCEWDADYAKMITNKDQQKIIRALEIMVLTKKKVSEHSWSPTLKLNTEYSVRGWMLLKDREELSKGIELRCHRMMEEGFLEEVHSLLEEGILVNDSASRAIGYKQWIEYIQKGMPEQRYSEYFNAFVSKTKKYTKNQITWFKKNPIFRKLDMTDASPVEIAEAIAADYLQYG